MSEIDGRLIVDLANAAFEAALESIKMKSDMVHNKKVSYLITMFAMAAVAARYRAFTAVMPNTQEMEAVKIFYRECLEQELPRTLKFAMDEQN